MLFFELIQFALSQRNGLSRKPTDEVWQQMYEMAVKQTLVGLLFTAVEKLNALDSTVKPPMVVFYQWLGETTLIEGRNRILDNAAAQLTQLFSDNGFRCCVMKGQGLARLYDKPCRRQSGDIDLWVEGGKKTILDLLDDNRIEYGNAFIHHVDAHIIEGVESEIHFIPIWMYNPFHNYRLQRYFREHSNEQFSNYDETMGFCYPTDSFNAIYILVHVFHHLLDEGVGLRQVIDYYFILKNTESIDYKDIKKQLRKFGLLKFVGAMMYVLKEVCGMKEDMMLIQPNEKAGKLLLQEILLTGNFGKYDERYDRKEHEGVVSANKRKMNRWIKLVRDYPAEVIYIPAWKLWHWSWRKWNGYL